MVPLVSLSYEQDNASSECGKWRGQVEMALRLLQSMEYWSPVARRSREVILEVYELSRRADVDNSLLRSGAEVQNHPSWDDLQDQQQNLLLNQVNFDQHDTWLSLWFSMGGEWPGVPMGFEPAIEGLTD